MIVTKEKLLVLAAVALLTGTTFSFLLPQRGSRVPQAARTTGTAGSLVVSQQQQQQQQQRRHDHHHPFRPVLSVSSSSSKLSSTTTSAAGNNGTSAEIVDDDYVAKQIQEALLDDTAADAAAAAAPAAEGTAAAAAAAAASPSSSSPPFRNVLAANRAEIAVRVLRAATELGSRTTAVYVKEDRYGQHRWGADRSYLLQKSSPEATPISAYLDIDQIIAVAERAGADAIHPGYGFLSENADFAAACGAAGITFVGPTVENLRTFSDKTTARSFAIDMGVPVVPGSDGPLRTGDEVVAFAERIGLPVILKAAMGGGGKGMRVVRDMDDLVRQFESASSEAATAFGDGSVFVERFVDRPRHVEVQILGDGTGSVVHLWERDCSVQRRHQKVIEIAPAWSLPMSLREQLHEYAVKLTAAAKYKNAGTVEFLIDADNRPYFIEVNPRIQVEHTVTEEVTGLDLVQAQMRIAAGATLSEIGFTQEKITCRGVAMQCRVTTEDPERDFLPDTGTLTLCRHAAGRGVRMDGIGYSGLVITPYFDSLIVKYTASGYDFPETVARMKRVLTECRIRGVKTNVPFLLNVLNHPSFVDGHVTTAFLDENPELKSPAKTREMLDSASQYYTSGRAPLKSRRFQKYRLIRYLAQLAVNGQPTELGADYDVLAKGSVTAPAIAPPVMTTDLKRRIEETAAAAAAAAGGTTTAAGWRHILKERGPAGFAAAVREHPHTLVMDTTWRDAHQSLLATRMRTKDLLAAAPYTNDALKAASYSTEMWGGATFDVAMRFLRECPWERLAALREACPDIPFQMLLRGANAVGYTTYPDNVVRRFCQEAVLAGMDVFRVFDSLNYLDNLKLGCQAAGAAGGVVEGAMSYTGNVADDTRTTKYGLHYYLDLADKLVRDCDVHCLAIKDMAGLLTPAAADALVSALRDEFPETPIHVHTHDTAGSGVASMLAAVRAGADVVDGAIDSMSGLTSQPSLGAIAAGLQGGTTTTTAAVAAPAVAGLDLPSLAPLTEYWDLVRTQPYAPFESGQLSTSSDVYFHEIPGGQYTNLLFQSKQLGLQNQWPAIKRAYEQANIVLGDIPKVTPSSKVVGDLAQFMVSSKLETAQEVQERADTLAFPDSVVSYLRGEIGTPPGGFPEPFRSTVLNARGLEPVDGRPGAALPPYDFDTGLQKLQDKFGKVAVSERDLLSYALYPAVFMDWKEFEAAYGDVGRLPTRVFLHPMKVGEEVEFDLEPGQTMIVKLISIEAVDEKDGSRMVHFEVNGEAWHIPVTDRAFKEQQQQAAGAGMGGGALVHQKADADCPGHVGSPMAGVIVDVKVRAGNPVREGEPVCTLSAMKMETSIVATKGGTVRRVLVQTGDKVEASDLLLEIDDGEENEEEQQ